MVIEMQQKSFFFSSILLIIGLFNVFRLLGFDGLISFSNFVLKYKRIYFVIISMLNKSC